MQVSKLSCIQRLLFHFQIFSFLLKYNWQYMDPRLFLWQGTCKHPWYSCSECVYHINSIQWQCWSCFCSQGKDFYLGSPLSYYIDDRGLLFFSHFYRIFFVHRGCSKKVIGMKLFAKLLSEKAPCSTYMT